MTWLIDLLTGRRGGWRIEGYTHGARQFQCSKCGATYYSVFRQYITHTGSMTERHADRAWSERAEETLEHSIPSARCPTCGTPSEELRDYERMDFFSKLFSNRRLSNQTRSLTSKDWKLFCAEFNDRQQMLHVILENEPPPKPWNASESKHR